MNKTPTLPSSSHGPNLPKSIRHSKPQAKKMWKLAGFCRCSAPSATTIPTVQATWMPWSKAKASSLSPFPNREGSARSDGVRFFSVKPFAIHRLLSSVCAADNRPSKDPDFQSGAHAQPPLPPPHIPLPAKAGICTTKARGFSPVFLSCSSHIPLIFLSYSSHIPLVFLLISHPYFHPLTQVPSPCHTTYNRK